MKKLKWICLVIVSWLLVLPVRAVPIISNVELTSIADTSMIVTWSTTNEAASTEIIWGAGGLTNITPVAGTSKYHSVQLTGLMQNTAYQFRVKSGDMIFPPVLPVSFSPLSFTTLEKPGGEYLFSFAVLNDLRYADFAGGKADTTSARGIPFSLGSEIIASEVTDINSFRGPDGGGVAFTVINGNLADNTVTYNTQISSETTGLKGILENLNGASIPSPAAYKYLPVPGFHDKRATYTTAADDWLSDNFLPLTTNSGSAESRLTSLEGYNAASKDADSIFNYQFLHNNYSFIFLDSLTDSGTGEANLSKVNSLLAAFPSKTFIFSSVPAYDPLDSDTKDYSLAIPTSEVGGGMTSLNNHGAFRSTIEAYNDASGNPIVAAVISGHLGDNFKRDIKGISYVRQGPAVQYPTGYSIYKVYSTGYSKTFYKTTGGSPESDGDTKPYYEYARDRISAETVSGVNIPAAALTQFWLGSASSRNFTYKYDFIPGLGPRVLSTGPVSGESSVSLNSPLLITFNKRLSTNNLGQWTTIRDSDGNTLGVSSESFIDASRTILKVTHPDFTVDKTYIATVNSSQIADEGSTPMTADFVFSFDTMGGAKDIIPPTASVDPIASNSTTDPFPLFTGIASDESRIINVEYRFDNTGDWVTAEAVDGKFTGTTEVFQIRPTAPLSAGSHKIWLRTSDGIGNISLTGSSVYTFTVIFGDKPNIASFEVDDRSVVSGDPISSTPKIEITITSNTSLESGRLQLAGSTTALSLVKVDTSYYATHEVTTALADGAYTFTVEAFDTAGNAATFEASSLFVQSAGSPTVQGSPLNYPNPFDPGSGTKTTTIAYSLSRPGNVVINFLDLAGNLLHKKTMASGQTGGQAGYNTVAWDGKTDLGDYVGSGIYIYLIIVDGQVAVNGKGKITVFKR